MHSSMRFIFAGTVFVACFQWTCIGASSSSGRINTLTNASSDCLCNFAGTVNLTCDNTTTECVCKRGYEGPNCIECQNGYYHHSDSSTECSPCQCNDKGSSSKDCDRFGTCLCKRGVGGEQCNRCLSDYYGFSNSGCKQCNCEETAIECLYVSKLAKDVSASSMCHNCLLNATWLQQCRKPKCPLSDYLLPNGSCTPCPCSQSLGKSNGSRHCDLMTGNCPKCEGESCPTEGKPNHFQYKAYIIASGAIAGLIVIILIILLTIYCRRRCRRDGCHTPLPLWTIELRHDNENDDDATQELAFDDLDVMYLDDSYLMEPSSEYFTESTDNINGRAGYHTLS